MSSFHCISIIMIRQSIDSNAALILGSTSLSKRQMKFNLKTIRLYSNIYVYILTTFPAPLVMSKEKTTGGQKDIKDFKARLQQYEKDLQEAKEKLKQEDDEVRAKNECAEKKRKGLEEKDKFIKDLKDKMNKNMEIKQMKPEEDSQMATLIEQIQSLEEELKEQIKKSEQKLEEGLQKCREMEQFNKETRCNMEEKSQLGSASSNTQLKVTMDKLPIVEQTIQKVSNTDLKMKLAEPVQELNDTNTRRHKLSKMKGGIAQFSVTPPRMTEEEMKLRELRKENEESLREKDELIKALREQVRTRDSEMQELKRGVRDYEQQLLESIEFEIVESQRTRLYARHFKKGPYLRKTIENEIKTMSDQLEEAECTLEVEKQKRKHESMMKETQLNEQRKSYEQQLKELTETKDRLTLQIEQLQQKNDEIIELLKKAEASFKEERESLKKEMEELRANHAKEMDDLRASCAKDKRDVIAIYKKDAMNIRFEVSKLVKEAVKEVIMEASLPQEIQKVGRELEGVKETFKQEMIELHRKIIIDEKEKPNVPPITAEAVAESNPTENCILSNSSIDGSVEHHFKPPIQETGFKKDESNNDKEEKN
uniref:Uncharacterized protein n=1 Tax=Amphimedon queenslandica TaxID=400682 RepID=A0A1X7TZB6_AMPQE